ncbi:hypothetical protein JCM3774_002028 [Rhodotorula dairenensis]
MSLVSPPTTTVSNADGQERRIKRGLRGLIQKYFSSHPDSPSSSAPASRASPASSLRPSRRRRDNATSGARGGGGGSTSNSPSGSRPVTPLRSHHPPSGVTVADRPITQPRPDRSHRRRRRRRTQSPVGLPIYSEQPTENEMSLFKSHDDAFPVRIDAGIDEGEDEDDEDDDDDDDGLEEIGSDGDETEDGRGRRNGAAREAEAEDDDEDTDAFFAMPPRQSLDVAYTDASGRRRSATNLVVGSVGEAPGRPTLVRGRPRAASEPLGHLRLTQQTTRSSLSRSFVGSHTSSNSPYLHGSSSPFASRSGLIELPPRPPSPPLSPRGAESPGSPSSYRGFPLRPSYFMHRSSRSSPIIVASEISSSSSTPSLLPTSTSAGSFGGGGGGGGRPRASTLQKLMSSSAGRSDASLAPPNGSEPLASAGRSGQSPYGFLGTRASASQVSVGGRSISAPLANSFVHSSFVFPKTGPTPEQVAFISSRQAIGAYGYGAGASPPPPLGITLSSQQGEGVPPPSTTTITESTPVMNQRQGLVAPIPIRGRVRSGSEASRMSAGGSPLARTVQLPPELDPPAATHVDADAGLGAATGETLASPRESSMTNTLAPSLPPLPTLESIATGLDFSLEDDEEDGPVAEQHETTKAAAAAAGAASGPPTLTTSAPTLTASALPSPVVPSAASFAATTRIQSS